MLSFSRHLLNTKCTYDSSLCGCTTNNGYISLKKYEDKPFQDTDPMNGYTYYWSPCKDITRGEIMSSCLQEDSMGNRFDCGAHKSFHTEVQGGNAAFHMDASDNLRHSEIVCFCKPGGKDTLKFEMEDPDIQGLYDVSLTDDSCCSKSGPRPGSLSGAGSLSIGSILLIIALVVAIVYLLAGVVIQSTVRKAEGSDRIPNVSFWSLLPGLVRDGFKFTFSCGKSSSYQQI